MPRTVLLFTILLSLAVSASARAQAVVKVDENTSFKVGTLDQSWAEVSQNPARDDYAKNIFLRRARIILGGTIGKQFGFFLDTDVPNLGKSSAGTKTLSQAVILQDGWFEWKPNDDVTVMGGLFYVPLCRNCAQAAPAHLGLDYGAYSFVQNAAMQGNNGRDSGVQVKGYAAGKKLEYRVAVLQGLRDQRATNGFRVAGRAQYSFWEADVTPFFYTGTTLGKKKLLVVGGGVDHQDDYNAFAVDVFIDRPAGPGAITAQANVITYDGGDFLTTVREQTTWMAETGYYHTASKLQPFVRVEGQRFANDLATLNDQTRIQAGLAYYLRGANANLKAAYQRIDNTTARDLHSVTVQFQVFYY
jgi:hypothetical protein